MSILQHCHIQNVPTKRRYIYQVLRDELLSKKLKSGSRLPTAAQLASRFSVSYVTMHSALADLVRDGLVVRQKGKGSFAAPKAGQKGRPMTTRLAMVLPVQADIASGGSMAETFGLLHGSSAGCAACGAELGIVSLPSFPQPPDLESALEKVLRYEGALFAGDQYALLMAALGKRGFPFLVVGAEHSSGSYVWYDQKAALSLAVDHLLAHGYRRIGFLGATGSRNNRKFELFRGLLEAHGVVLEPAWVQDCIAPLEAYPAARRFLDHQPRPEAVFVDNHLKARTLISAAVEHGLKVPQDLAVVGYGAEAADGDLALVALPYEEMGREGAMLLDKLVRGAVVAPVQRRLSSRMAIRQSCGCRVDGPGSTSSQENLQTKEPS